MTEPMPTHTQPPVTQPVAQPASYPADPFPQPAPAPPVTYSHPAALDLDKLEREDATTPFDFMLNGKRYLMSDPKEVDWQDMIAAMSSPHMFFRLVLPAEDRQEFFATRLPAWKMNALMERYQDHYGLPTAPNAAGLPR